MIIVLPCRTSDDLDWNIEKTIQQPIIWEFDLGLGDPYFPMNDELKFSSLKLALSHFTKNIWPDFCEKTKKAILYRGSADFASFFHWSETQEENWRFWKKERVKNGSEEHLRRLFCIDAFSHYLRLLSTSLPDELELSLYFETDGCGSKAEIRQLLSKERFEHFDVIADECNAPLAICMPPESECGDLILKKLDRLFHSLKEPYRVIEETFLIESLEGVDRIYVISEAVLPQGRRKLMGFCAAGGMVIVEGEPLGLPNEISSEKYIPKVIQKLAFGRD